MVTPDQLTNFFSEEIGEDEYETMMDMLERSMRIHKHKQYKIHDVYSEYEHFRMSQQEVEDFLSSFWVITNYGSENIDWIFSCLGIGPTKYVYAFPTGEIHDLAVIKTAEDARIAYIKRTEEDPEIVRIHHQALLVATATDDILAALRKYGFEGYFKLNDKHVASYYGI